MGGRLPWAEAIVTALVIATGAGVYLYAHKDEGALEESKRRGAELVQALHSYRREHGTYPGQLEDLTPQYVATIEPPTWGLRRWRYRRYAPDDVGAAPHDAGAAPGDTDVTPDDAGGASADHVYFQLSVAADASGYPVLYYDFAARRWVLNN
jgi:type II secretory pathway pseudopilin PulG